MGHLPTLRYHHTMIRQFRTLAAALLVLCTTSHVGRAETTEVDAELFLAVDVSRSMSERELEIQRRGYAEALVSEPVLAAIKNGPLGQIAVTFVEWGGAHFQRIVVDWTLIDDIDDLRDVATRLTTQFDGALRRTSISGVLDHATKSFETNTFSSNRKIIDISGDGPNNQGRAVLDARSDALAEGITINGLPLMTKEGVGLAFHLDDLDEYYRNCVIGGSGAFVIPVRKWEEFTETVRRKLVLELAAHPQTPRITRVNFKGGGDGPYDCFVGEKIWQNFIDSSPFRNLP
ncbi:MAG: DUF1194 domain-containing protein [Pseudomonadota bacterium]